VKGDEMGRECSVHGDVRNTDMILIEILVRKRYQGIAEGYFVFCLLTVSFAIVSIDTTV
jgi:hypothetical protein